MAVISPVMSPVVDPVQPSIVPTTAAGDGRTLDLQFALDRTIVPRVGPTPVFTRSNIALELNDGGVTSRAIDVPRFEYDTEAAREIGMAFSSRDTNNVFHNRDGTNAAWAKANITATKDQTGVDGVANSATKLTANAANGTCLQSMSGGGSWWHGAIVFLRRITGTGDIQYTPDNGTTWFTIAITNDWKEYRIPTEPAKQTNPTFGFRIVTSGDEIAFDYLANRPSSQIHGQPKTLIETAGATNLIEEERLIISGGDFSSLYNTDEGTILCELDMKFNTDESSGDHGLWALSNGGASANSIFNQLSAFRGSRMRTRLTTASVTEWEHYANSTYWNSGATRKKNVVTWKKSTDIIGVWEAGVELAYDVTTKNWPTTENELRIGKDTATPLSGWLVQFVYWPFVHSQAVALAMSV